MSKSHVVITGQENIIVQPEIKQTTTGINSEKTHQTGALSHDLEAFIEQKITELPGIEGNIQSASGKKEIKSIFVTSCSPSEGKTISAISIAYGLSFKTDSKVVLIDGNSQCPKLHNLFNVENEPGLSDLFALQADYKSILRKTIYNNLHVIPYGSSSINMADTFKSNMFRERLLSEMGDVDYVIFDGHPVFGSFNSPIITKYFDGTILTVECEKTRWEVVSQAKEKIESVEGNILGVVLNKRKYYIPKALYGRR